MTSLGDKNVGGFDVSVNDTFAVGGVERISHLDGEREQNIQVQRAARDDRVRGRCIRYPNNPSC